MATREALEDALVSAIADLTVKATARGMSAPNVLKLAGGANQLAEALAWVRRPDQAHGGSLTAE